MNKQNQPKNNLKKVAIIGAGLVGPVMAMYLLRRGYQVTLYEKRRDLRLLKKNEGRSINLIITSRGLKALEELGISKQVLEITVPVYGRMIHGVDGKQIYQPYGVSEKECNYSVSRSELNKILLTLALEKGAQAHFEHELESVDFRSKTLLFKSHALGKITVQADHIIATDGAGSLARKSLKDLYNKNPEKGQFVESIEPLGVDYKELLMPTKSNGDPALDERALHIWPRGSFMLMGLPNKDHTQTMTLYLPSTGKKSFATINDNQKLSSFFTEFFTDAITLLPELKQDFFNNPVGHLATVRCYPWHFEDQLVLLGDAAHAIVPFFGQGMNAGLEDCTLLNKILDEEDDNWQVSLARFSATQKPNADAIAQMAIENYHEMSSHVADPKFLLKKQVEQLLRQKFPFDFINRYALITYSLVPYSLALEAGIIHQEILQQLCQGINRVEDVDLKLAENLIKNKIPGHLKPTL